MKIKGYNTTEIANRYYQKLGKNYDRDQAKRNYDSLKNPRLVILREVLTELYEEGMYLLDKELMKR